MTETKTLQIETWPIERLIPYARNARRHSPAQVAQIAASIAEFGFNNPVLADAEGGIIAGHGRVLAARQLGWTEVPVVVLAHLNANQKRAFMLADNKLALEAGWDEQMLRLELEALCGDGTSGADLALVLEGRKCDLVFTDLPYNVDYRSKGRRPMQMANDHLGSEFGTFLRDACKSMLGVSQGPLYICMSSSELHRLFAAFTEGGGHWSTYIIWAKNTFTLGRSDYQRQYEPILYGWPEGSPHFWCGDRDRGDVWQIDKPRRNDLHPTMKPVELIERALVNSSRKGGVVLDPFAGSGSTVIACEKTGRHARAIELDARYVDVIVKRWQGCTGGEAQLEPGGQSFERVASERLGKKTSEPEESGHE